MLREKQMSVSRELEEKQTTCQQLQTSADELEVQIDTLSEERQRVSFQHLNYNSYPLVKDCVISWSSPFARNLCGGRWERVFSTFPGRHFMAPSLVSPRNDVWEISAEIPYWWRITTQIWVVLLIGRATWDICFNQSEALPRSGLWRVISMDFLRSFLRRHCVGKPMVASSNVGCFLRLPQPPCDTKRPPQRRGPRLRRWPPFFAYWVTGGTTVPW